MVLVEILTFITTTGVSVSQRAVVTIVGSKNNSRRVYADTLTLPASQSKRSMAAVTA